MIGENKFTPEQFVRESNRIEGILRDPTEGEISEYERFLQLPCPEISDLERFVHIYQPGAKLRDQVGRNVRIGTYYPPMGGIEIKNRLIDLLEEAHIGNAYLTHISYEKLHPFTDGNGRSGRMLWAWQMVGRYPLGFLHTFYYQTLDYLQHTKAGL